MVAPAIPRAALRGGVRTIIALGRNWWKVLILVLFIVVIVVWFLPFISGEKTIFGGPPATVYQRSIGAGIIAPVIFLGIAMLSRGNWNPLALITGSDQNWSASIAQFLIWNLVGLFAIIAYASYNFFAQGSADLANAISVDLSQVPPNLLAAMGFGAVTYAGASAIATSQSDQGQLPSNGANQGGLLKSADGQADLGKAQMLTWTVIAASVFVAKVVEHLQRPGQGFPDIDPVFMVFTGLSSAAYLGKKLTSSSAPIISSLLTATASNIVRVGDSVSLAGSQFGSTQSGSQLLFDTSVVEVKSWQDTQITFIIPPFDPRLDPQGRPKPWRARCGNGNNQTKVYVSVIVNGRQSNTQQLTIEIPNPSIAPPLGTASPDNPVQLDGCRFGQAGNPVNVLLGPEDSPMSLAGNVVTVGNTLKVQFTVPSAGQLSALGWNTNTAPHVRVVASVTDANGSQLDSDPIYLTVTQR